MKKLLFGAVALAMLATASCKKDDDNASGPSNSVTAAGQTYAVTNVTVNRNVVAIYGGSGNTDAAIMTLTFATGTASPSDGTYNIVEDADASNEVELGVLRYVNSTITSYTSQDGSPNVTVKVENGKMRVSFPNTSVKPIPGRGSENITVSANAMQP